MAQVAIYSVEGLRAIRRGNFSRVKIDTEPGKGVDLVVDEETAARIAEYSASDAVTKSRIILTDIALKIPAGVIEYRDESYSTLKVLLKDNRVKSIKYGAMPSAPLIAGGSTTDEEISRFAPSAERPDILHALLPALVRELAANDSLQRLSISYGADISSEQLEKLQIALSERQERKRVVLERLSDGKLFEEYVQLLRENPEVLSLSENQISVEGARALADALKENNALRELHLYNNQIGVEGTIALADALKENNALRKLYLEDNQIGDEGTIALADALKENNTLRELALGINQIGDEGARALADALKTNTALRGLYLESNQIGYEGIIAFADALRENNALRELSLGGNQIGNEGTIALADVLKTNTALQGLYLPHTRIDNEGATAFADALRENDTLQSLDLGHNQIGDEGIIALADALKENNALRKLYLKDNRIGDEGTIALADALKTNTALQGLYLQHTGIDNEGATAFADALRENDTLQILDLGHNQIGVEGIIALADALKTNTALQNLSLPHARIDNERATAFADALRENDTLQILDLRFNQIGNEGAIALADALRENDTLQTLDLGFNQIGDEGIIALADALRENVTLLTVGSERFPPIISRHLSVNRYLHKHFPDLSIEEKKVLKAIIENYVDDLFARTERTYLSYIEDIYIEDIEDEGLMAHINETVRNMKLISHAYSVVLDLATMEEAEIDVIERVPEDDLYERDFSLAEEAEGAFKRIFAIDSSGLHTGQLKAYFAEKLYRIWQEAATQPTDKKRKIEHELESAKSELRDIEDDGLDARDQQERVKEKEMELVELEKKIAVARTRSLFGLITWYGSKLAEGETDTDELDVLKRHLLTVIYEIIPEHEVVPERLEPDSSAKIGFGGRHHQDFIESEEGREKYFDHFATLIKENLPVFTESEKGLSMFMGVTIDLFGSESLEVILDFKRKEMEIEKLKYEVQEIEDSEKEIASREDEIERFRGYSRPSSIEDLRSFFVEFVGKELTRIENLIGEVDDEDTRRKLGDAIKRLQLLRDKSVSYYPDILGVDTKGLDSETDDLVATTELRLR